MNDIDRACAAFRTLLTEQQARVAGMTAERVELSAAARHRGTGHSAV